MGSGVAGKPLARALAVALALLAMLACGGGSSPAESPLSEDVRAGEALFDANCSACHGVGAVGTDAGPPLVHEIYHPGHHSDVSFRSAVRVGVMQHHWFFGDMPPVAGVSPDEVDKIICYIRETQRAHGVFEGDGYNTVC